VSYKGKSTVISCPRRPIQLLHTICSIHGETREHWPGNADLGELDALQAHAEPIRSGDDQNGLLPKQFQMPHIEYVRLLVRLIKASC
jgi:hypothetical protein